MTTTTSNLSNAETIQEVRKNLLQIQSIASALDAALTTTRARHLDTYEVKNIAELIGELAEGADSKISELEDELGRAVTDLSMRDLASTAAAT